MSEMPETVRVRQAYVVYTTLAHLPAFLDAPESLRPPFRLLAQGDPVYLGEKGSDEQQRELWDRFDDPQAGRFVPGMGPIADGAWVDWALTRASAPASHRGHVPWLIQPNWRLAFDPAALEIDGWPGDRPLRAGPSLALHLYAYGLVAVCLRLPLHCGPGLAWRDFIALVKAASPFQAPQRQAAAYTLRIGRHTTKVQAGQIADRAAAHLAQDLFQAPAAYQVQRGDEARLHTFVYVQDTLPGQLDPDRHYPLMAGLMLMRPRWQDVAGADARAFRRLDGDLGHLAGDWVKVNDQRVGLIPAPAYRKSRRKYLWRLHAWAELARAQAYLAQLSVPLLADLAADPALPVSPDRQAFWRDLPRLGVRAQRQRLHRRAYPVFAGAVDLDAALEEFADFYADFEAVERRPPTVGGQTAVDLGVLAELLRAAFTADALQRFCRDRALFRPVLADVGQRPSPNEMADALIDYAWKRDLLDELLQAVEDDNDRQYARFRHRLRPGIGGRDGH